MVYGDFKREIYVQAMVLGVLNFQTNPCNRGPTIELPNQGFRRSEGWTTTSISANQMIVMVSSSPKRVSCCIEECSITHRTQFNLRPETAMAVVVLLLYKCIYLIVSTISSVHSPNTKIYEGQKPQPFFVFCSSLLTAASFSNSTGVDREPSKRSTAEVNPGSLFHIFRSIKHVSTRDFRLQTNSQSHQSHSQFSSFSSPYFTIFHHRFRIDLAIFRLWVAH